MKYVTIKENKTEMNSIPESGEDRRFTGSEKHKRKYDVTRRGWNTARPLINLK